MKMTTVFLFPQCYSVLVQLISSRLLCTDYLRFPGSLIDTQICGEVLPLLSGSMSSKSFRSSFKSIPEIKTVLEEKSPPTPVELFDKEKAEPLIWSFRELHIRNAHGGSRKITIPLPFKIGEYSPTSSNDKDFMRL